MNITTMMRSAVHVPHPPLARRRGAARSLATLVGSLALALAVASPAWAATISVPVTVAAGDTFVISGSDFPPGAHVPCVLIRNSEISDDVDLGIAVADSHGHFAIEVRMPAEVFGVTFSVVCEEETLLAGFAAKTVDVYPPRTEPRDLGLNARVLDVNLYGQGAGWVDRPTGGIDPAFYPSTSSVVVLECPAPATCQGAAIGDLANVVGNIGSLPTVWFPVAGGSFSRQTLPLLLNDNFGVAANVSPNGIWIVGTTTSGPVKWTRTGNPFTAYAVTRLPFVIGDTFANPVAISDSDRIVGDGGRSGTGSTHGVEWLPNGGGDYSAVALLPLPEDSFASARQVNEAGVAVGRSFRLQGSQESSRAVYWASNGSGAFPPIRLPALLGGGSSKANAINGPGVIVGSANRPDGSSAGVVWSAGGTQVVDLDTLLPQAIDITITEATAINDHGQIAVSATQKSTGTPLAVLLTPQAGGRRLVNQVAVSDAAVTPPSATVPQGGSVQWENAGTAAHTVTDSTGLNRFDSGALGPRRGFVASFPAAGSYPYRDTLNPSLAGTVTVPVDTVPASGTTATTFQIYWASAVPAGLVEDVQIQRPGATNFVDWRTGQTGRLAAFLPDGGVGTYNFRARLRNPATGAATEFSPPAAFPVTLAPDLFLGPSVNQSRFAPGETLQTSFTLSNPGLPDTVDIVAGLLLPDGHTLFSLTQTGVAIGDLSNLTTLQPLVNGLSLATPFAVGLPDFLVHQWTGTEPRGTYTAFMLALRTGSIARGVPPTDMVGLALNVFQFP